MRYGYAARRISGFSLVELLVSAAILGLLATVAMPMVELTAKREKEHNLRVALRDIRAAIDAYKTAASAGKITLLPGQSGYPPTLSELINGVTDATNPNGPKLYFLRRLPRDPFYPDMTTPAIDTWGKRSYASPPDAPHAGDDVFDVYSQSTLTGLNGVPYSEW
jgi:general secretion pathway protein G